MYICIALYVIYDSHLWVCLWLHFAKHDVEPIQQETVPNFSIMIGRNCNHTGLTICCTLEAEQVPFYIISWMWTSLYVDNSHQGLYCVLNHASRQTLFFRVLFTISGASDWEPPGAEGAGGQGPAGGFGEDEEGEPGVKGQTLGPAASKAAAEPDHKPQPDPKPETWWRGQCGMFWCSLSIVGREVE